ncbi:zinc ribbon domain-containing protein [Trinickia terrae]|uniref:Zinc ribbon domain-containing protein n=1 Tax=Trinickia terrae TaxID=2571161 RepID=A0A4U1IDP4_9BURK|nr:zinc ribbon domain-containing protein [Trinickia terrae]TKC91697.1 zinc ribbon domain-containing protein [Trinickia terrae]
MLTDCPHCYKPMHDEAEVCPHCTREVQNASGLSGASIDSDGIVIRFLAFVIAFFFALGMALDYLDWWRSWEFFPCVLVSVLLAFVLSLILS